MMINGDQRHFPTLMANRMKRWKPNGAKRYYDRLGSYIRMICGYISTERFCSGCGITKSVNEYYPRQSNANTRESVHGKLATTCKECVRATVRQWRVNNTERARKNSSDWIKRNPIAHRVRKYGLTKDTYLAMVKSHCGRCAICNSLGKELQVDHCHVTGKVRGLLCVGCNTALGKFKDDIRQLQSAIEYLRRYNGDVS